MMKKVLRCLLIVVMSGFVAHNVYSGSREARYREVERLVACYTPPTNKYEQKRLARLSRVLARMCRKTKWVYENKYEKKFAYLAAVLAQEQEQWLLKRRYGEEAYEISSRFFRRCEEEQRKGALSASVPVWREDLWDDYATYAMWKHRMRE